LHYSTNNIMSSRSMSSSGSSKKTFATGGASMGRHKTLKVIVEGSKLEEIWNELKENIINPREDNVVTIYDNYVYVLNLVKNPADSTGESLLMLAVRHNNIQMVELICRALKGYQFFSHNYDALTLSCTTRTLKNAVIENAKLSDVDDEEIEAGIDSVVRD